MKLAKVRHASLRLTDITPSPENQELYRAVSAGDPATVKLAKTIRKTGVMDPLVVSADGFIISGHRRHCVAGMLGLKEVPCQIVGIRRGRGKKPSPGYLEAIAAFNDQRVKTRDEMLREEIIARSTDPKRAHRELLAYRKRKARVRVETMELREGTRRKEISEAKRPFLEAVQKIIASLEEYWPLNIRQLHYQLLNAPPLIHAAKPNSGYRNDPRSYNSLIDLVTRARHEGSIDYKVIDDPTRPVTIWNVKANLADYYREQIKDFLRDYWRDLLQSQPNHIEIVVEKNTVSNIVSPIAAKFCLPLTVGRGQCSTRPLYNIAQRFKASGKAKLIILAASDLDPDGDAIAHSLGQRLRDDYGVSKVAVIKCALTIDQVRDLGLAEKYERAKKGSSNYQRYFEAYETNRVWELEALQPAVLQSLLAKSVESVIDRAAFNAELENEASDEAHNRAVRSIVLETLRKQIDTPET